MRLRGVKGGRNIEDRRGKPRGKGRDKPRGRAADCPGGVWARKVEGPPGPGDLEKVLDAARGIGDHHLRRQACRVPQPHSFARGASDQPMRWFARGYHGGQIQRCDTCGASSP